MRAAEQVIYVWWDALANYITALGYGADQGERQRAGGRGPQEDFDRWWRGGDERVHVIGKGILRFHAVHWLALLLAAGVPLPTHMAVHDHLTVDGVKISKSGRGAVDPACPRRTLRRGRGAVVVAA